MPANIFVSVEYYKLFSHTNLHHWLPKDKKKKKIKALRIGLRLAKHLKSAVFHVNEVSRNFFFVT